MSPSLIPGLDGFRGIAFLLVYGIHTDYVQAGWVGVQFFFVLGRGMVLDMKKSLRPPGIFLQILRPAFSAIVLLTTSIYY